MHPLLLLYKTIHIYKPQPHGRYRNIKRHGFSSRLSILRNLLRNNTACRWAVDANSIDFRYHGCSEEEDLVRPRSELAGLSGHSTRCETGHVPGVWLWSIFIFDIFFQTTTLPQPTHQTYTRMFIHACVLTYGFPFPLAPHHTLKSSAPCSVPKQSSLLEQSGKWRQLEQRKRFWCGGKNVSGNCLSHWNFGPISASLWQCKWTLGNLNIFIEKENLVSDYVTPSWDSIYS